jgi:hypothetical protein
VNTRARPRLDLAPKPIMEHHLLWVKLSCEQSFHPERGFTPMG